MESELSEKMADRKAEVNSILINHEFEVLDKFQKRVLVFLLVMGFITLVITLAMTFISRTEYLIVTAVSYVVLCVCHTTNLTKAVVDIVVVYVLVVSDGIRKRFPLNLMLTMLHSACLTVLSEVAFIGREIVWVLFVLVLALVLYITCVSMGAKLRRELHVGTIRMLIGYIVFSVAIAVATVVVFTLTKYYEESPKILAAGITVLVIPFALYVGQITIGQLEFRVFDPDYCTAAMNLHATFIIFLIALGIGFIRPRRIPMMLNLLESNL
uniref:Uncharacterized protein n=1 Tax=Trichobilharzia regenti TaxID=157069 RepID=A0AA85KCI3_TRIRE|nr:unnamed protein product [Trichobilharzia regenti]